MENFHALNNTIYFRNLISDIIYIKFWSNSMPKKKKRIEETLSRGAPFKFGIHQSENISRPRLQ